MFGAVSKIRTSSISADGEPERPNCEAAERHGCLTATTARNRLPSKPGAHGSVDSQPPCRMCHALAVVVQLFGRPIRGLPWTEMSPRSEPSEGCRRGALDPYR